VRTPDARVLGVRGRDRERGGDERAGPGRARTGEQAATADPAAGVAVQVRAVWPLRQGVRQALRVVVHRVPFAGADRRRRHRKTSPNATPTPHQETVIIALTAVDVGPRTVDGDCSPGPDSAPAGYGRFAWSEAPGRARQP